MVNERQYLGDWNPVWTVKTGRFDGGWTVEAVLPFKSLRYRGGRDQVWGFNAMRVKRSDQRDVHADARAAGARADAACSRRRSPPRWSACRRPPPARCWT